MFFQCRQNRRSIVVDHAINTIIIRERKLLVLKVGTEIIPIYTIETSGRCTCRCCSLCYSEGQVGKYSIVIADVDVYRLTCTVNRAGRQNSEQKGDDVASPEVA